MNETTKPETGTDLGVGVDADVMRRHSGNRALLTAMVAGAGMAPLPPVPDSCYPIGAKKLPGAPGSKKRRKARKAKRAASKKSRGT